MQYAKACSLRDNHYNQPICTPMLYVCEVAKALESLSMCAGSSESSVICCALSNSFMCAVSKKEILTLTIQNKTNN